jgi:hypothetical protein
MGGHGVSRMPRQLDRPTASRVSCTRDANRMKRLFRALRLAALAVLIVWGIYAPLFAYNRGHLIGYRDGVTDTLTRIVKAWPLVPLKDNTSKPL